MFTGIVEEMGSVAEVTEREKGRRLVLSLSGPADVGVGASLCVNGVCLTAVEVGETSVAVDVIPETLRRTNLGRVVVGDAVNLERAMSANGRFDGHIVQGHVDGVGTVEEIEKAGDDVVMTIKPPSSLMPYIVEKGSITVDGISLTVAAIDPEALQVALIPHTLEVTTFGLRKPGDAVNLEVDVLAKYVERLLEARQ